jgi:hypothetical protein
MVVSILSRSTSVSVGLLPGAFADVVADGVAEHAGHRIGLGEVFCLLADHDREFALVVDLFGRGGRDHDIFIVSNQGILGAIADLGPVRHVRYRAGLVGGFLQMLEVVQSDAIEGARDQRQLDLHILQRMGLRAALPLPEGIAVDGDHLVAFDEPP